MDLDAAVTLITEDEPRARLGLQAAWDEAAVLGDAAAAWRVSGLMLLAIACTSEGMRRDDAAGGSGGAGNDAGDSDATPGTASCEDVTPGAWSWVEVAGTECADGSPVGIGVSLV